MVEVIGMQKAEQLVAVQQICRLARGATLAQIAGRGQQPQPRAAKGQRTQRGVAQLADTDGHVYPPLHQIDKALRAVQLQLDGRITTTKLADNGHQPMEDKRRGRIDPQYPLRLFAAHQQQPLRLAHLGQDLHRPLIEPAPLLGQADPPRGAIEQHG